MEARGDIPTLRLNKNNKRFQTTLWKIVAEAWLGIDTKYYKISYKDENVYNTALDNLVLWNGFLEYEDYEMRPVRGLEKYLEVSNYGDIWDIDFEVFRSLGETYTKEGRYYKVGVTVDGVLKHFTVHRLVALTFCEGHSKELVANHLDSNTFNNRADNLEWTTAQGNIQHMIKAGRQVKASSLKVAQYTLEGSLVATYGSATDASLAVGVSRPFICTVARTYEGRSTRPVYKAKGFIWKYV